MCTGPSGLGNIPKYIQGLNEVKDESQTLRHHKTDLEASESLGAQPLNQ